MSYKAIDNYYNEVGLFAIVIHFIVGKNVNICVLTKQYKNKKEALVCLLALNFIVKYAVFYNGEFHCVKYK